MNEKTVNPVTPVVGLSKIAKKATFEGRKSKELQGVYYHYKRFLEITVGPLPTKYGQKISEDLAIYSWGIIGFNTP